MILKGRNTSPNTLWTQRKKGLQSAISKEKYVENCMKLLSYKVTNLYKLCLFASRHKDSLVGSRVCFTDEDFFHKKFHKDLRDQLRPHKPHGISQTSVTENGETACSFHWLYINPFLSIFNFFYHWLVIDSLTSVVFHQEYISTHLVASFHSSLQHGKFNTSCTSCVGLLQFCSLKLSCLSFFVSRANGPQMSSSVFPLSKLGLSRNTAEMYSMLYDSYDVISWQIATLNTSQLSLENISAKKLKTTHKNRHGQCDTWSSQLSQSDVGSSQHWSSSHWDQPLGRKFNNWKNINGFKLCMPWALSVSVSISKTLTRTSQPSISVSVFTYSTCTL